MKFFFDKDADLTVLQGKTIAVLGFGSQGSTQAQNMKDSGLKIIVGLKKNSKSVSLAKKLGFEVMSAAKAVKKADIIHFLIPDQVQAKVFKKEIEPFLDKTKSLCFAHGLNIVLEKIVPPKGIDVFMFAPHAPGPAVRELFLQNSGVPALFAIHQNASGKARQTVLAMAKACGFTRAGVYEVSFEQETFSDLFAEQTVLCGGLSELVKNGFETLVEAGYPKELAFFSTAYEIKLIAKLLAENGVEGMFAKISNTAEYGSRTRGPRIIDKKTKQTMKQILKEIESKKFGKEWLKESENGLVTLFALRKQAKNHSLQKTFESLKKQLI